jgi:hypothetical protein
LFDNQPLHPLLLSRVEDASKIQDPRANLTECLRAGFYVLEMQELAAAAQPTQIGSRVNSGAFHPVDIQFQTIKMTALDRASRFVQVIPSGLDEMAGPVGAASLALNALFQPGAGNLVRLISQGQVWRYPKTARRAASSRGSRDWRAGLFMLPERSGESRDGSPSKQDPGWDCRDGLHRTGAPRGLAAQQHRRVLLVEAVERSVKEGRWARVEIVEKG